MGNKWIGRGTLALLALYWLALCTGTHIPQPPMGLGGGRDKAIHFLAYAGLAWLLSAAAASKRAVTWQLLLLVFMVTIAYGALDELSQIPVPGRYSELRDWVADALGAASGVALFAACHAGWLLIQRTAVIGPAEPRSRPAEKSSEGLA